MHRWADATLRMASTTIPLPGARKAIAKRLHEKWQRLQALAFYKAECLQKVIRTTLAERATKLKTKHEDQEQESMDESNQQDGERANDDTQTEKEEETEGEPNKQTRTRTVTCTGTYCMINRQLDSENQLRIGKMTPGSTGCTKCTRFRRTRKMVKAAEDALLESGKARAEIAKLRTATKRTRVENIAQTAHRIVNDDNVWNPPKREGRRRTMAEHQTTAAKHLANTVLINTANAWNGPDAQLSDQDFSRLAQSAKVTCNGTCGGDEQKKITHAQDTLPAICPQCKMLQKLGTTSTEYYEDDENAQFCITCDKELKKSERQCEVCEACQIYWLLHNNRMEHRLTPYLEKGKQEQQGEESKEGESETEQQRNKRPRPTPGNLYTDARTEPIADPTKKKRRAPLAELHNVARMPATTPMEQVQEQMTRRIESDDKQFLDTRRGFLVIESAKTSANRSTRSKRKETNYVPPDKRQKRIDREIGKLTSKQSNNGNNGNTITVADGNSNSNERNPRTICETQPTNDILEQGSNINADYVNEFLRIFQKTYPEAQCAGTYLFKILSERGWEQCKNQLWDECESREGQRDRSHLPGIRAPLLVFPIFDGPQNAGHFCVVIRERLASGKLLYFQMDSYPGIISDEKIRRSFEETAKFAKPASGKGPRCETLWNSEPGMTEWHRIHVPHQATGTQDCAPLTCANTAMYVTIRRKNPTLFHDTSKTIEFTAKRDEQRVLAHGQENGCMTAFKTENFKMT